MHLNGCRTCCSGIALKSDLIWSLIHNDEEWNFGVMIDFIPHHHDALFFTHKLSLSVYLDDDWWVTWYSCKINNQSPVTTAYFQFLDEVHFNFEDISNTTCATSVSGIKYGVSQIGKKKYSNNSFSVTTIKKWERTINTDRKKRQTTSYII